MVTSDRISAFDVQWKGEDGLDGVPGKGAALNAVSAHWFRRFKERGLSDSHIVDVIHPMAWLVQRAEAVLVEAIARDYLAGSMWRDYRNGKRTICGHELPDGLTQHQKLPETLLTPTTKGIIKGIPGIEEHEDANVTREQLRRHYQVFGFKEVGDVSRYEMLLREGFSVISRDLARLGKAFVDTKMELGYVNHPVGGPRLIYVDEVGTPDSSRIWSREEYEADPLGVTEESKEGFRKFLISEHGDVLVGKHNLDARRATAANYRVPVDEMMRVSRIYQGIAKTITGEVLPKMEDPRGELIAALGRRKLLV
jgi:phosphoribosylaminoimidazole-succinocarboxamide synthase